jgi:hypothetical protein
MKCSLLVLSSYLDGELEVRRQGELEAHLVGCQRCRSGLGYLREEVDRVSALGRVSVAEHSIDALLVQLGLTPAPEVETLWAGAYDEDSIDMTGSPVHDGSFWEPPASELAAAVEVPAAAELPAPDLPPDEHELAAAGELVPELAVAAELPAPDLAPDEHEPAAAAELPAPDLSPDEHELAAAELPAPDLAPAEHEPAAAELPAPDLAPAEHELAAAAELASAGELAPELAAAPELAVAAELSAPPELPAAELAPPELAPSIPHAVPPASPPAAAAPPPTPVRQWPPPLPDPDQAPFAPLSAGAFPPDGPEPSDLPDHVTASGGDAEMTASPPWTPREAPPEPTYPMTDADVLDEPVPVERFGPPQQARPSLFERLRDRVAVRRALSRSAAEYDDSVQVFSGDGAPVRNGRHREAMNHPMHMGPGGIPGGEAAEPSDPGDEVDLGPLPPTAPFVSPGATPMPRPGQLAIPGTDDHPSRQVMGTPMPTRAETPSARPDEPPHPAAPIAPPPRPDWPTPMHPGIPIPPPRHSLESAIGDPPPLAPRPPAPDPLAEALSEYERGRGVPTEPRPWRPREIPEDVIAAEPPAPPRAERSATADRPRHSPSQLRESRRLQAIFGAATLVMLIVGIVSGRTTTPLPSSTSTAQSSQPAQAQKPASSQPAARASAAAPKPSAAAQQSSKPATQPAPGGVPQLTGVKVLGDTGSGYQVKDFRYGQHPNDFRIVLDMDAAGTAAGTPKATVGFLDSTTMLVVIEGVVPAGSTGSLPPGSVATAITLMQPSPFPNAITYQVKLARAVTFTAGYVPGPLRLVLDLAG